MGAAKEAIRQAGIMMEKMKMVREASQVMPDPLSTATSRLVDRRLTLLACSIRIWYLKTFFPRIFASVCALHLYTHWVF